MQRGAYRLLPWAALAGFVALSLAAWYATLDRRAAVRRDDFDRLVEQVAHAIEQRLWMYTDVEYGGVGLFHASDDVSRDEFHDYALSLEIGARFPGVQGFGYVERVDPDELAEYLAETRADGAPSYEIWPPAERGFYLPVKYMEPAERNAGALGYDVASEPDRRDTLLRALETASPAMSDRITLVQDRRERPGFMMALPVYEGPLPPPTLVARRDETMGFIYTVFIAEDFVESVLDHELGMVRPEIYLQVFEGQSTDSMDRLYGEPPAEHDSRWKRSRTLHVRLHDQTWTLVVDTTPDWEHAYEGTDLVVLGAGMALSATLFALLLSVIRTRDRAEALADGMTIDLREKGAALEQRNLQLMAAHRETEKAADALVAQQATLARADRLAAVGELAAGLAHEIRNPLAGIQMSLENLRRETESEDVGGRLDLVIGELHRLSRLLGRHLEGARHAPEPAVALDLGELTTDLLALVRSQVPAHIELVSQVGPGLTVTLPRDRVRQALLNLILNSVDALGDAEGHVVVGAERADDVLVLSVEDDGPGFPPDSLEGARNLFESMKEGGTGLGLAIARRLALDLAGRLELSNREPRGARVELRIPV